MNEIDDEDDDTAAAVRQSPEISSIVPIYDDGPDVRLNMLRTFDGGQVYFPCVPKTYILGSEFLVKFTILNKVNPLSGDWIGLFKDGCQSLEQFVAYRKVPEFYGRRWYPIEMSVWFSSKGLPVEIGPSKLYKFVYVTESAKVAGVSSSFWFLSKKDDYKGVQQTFNEMGEIVTKHPFVMPPKFSSEILLGAVGQGEAACRESLCKFSPIRKDLRNYSHATKAVKSISDFTSSSVLPEKYFTHSHQLLNSDRCHSARNCKGCFQYACDMKVICDKMRELKIVNTSVAAEKALVDDATLYATDAILEENLCLTQQVEQLLQENERLRDENLRRSVLERRCSTPFQEPEVHVKFAIYMNFSLDEKGSKSELVNKLRCNSSIEKPVTRREVPKMLSPLSGSGENCKTYGESSHVASDEDEFELPVSVGVKRAMANTQITMFSKMLQAENSDASVEVDKSEENIRCNLKLPEMTCSQDDDNCEPESSMHEEVLHLLKGLKEFFNKKNEDVRQNPPQSEIKQTGAKPKMWRRSNPVIKSTSSSRSSLSSTTQEPLNNSPILNKECVSPKEMLKNCDSSSSASSSSISLPNHFGSSEDLHRVLPPFYLWK